MGPIKVRPLPPKTAPGDGPSTPSALFHFTLFSLSPPTGLGYQHRKGDQKAENAEKSRKYEAKDGAKLNGGRRCDGQLLPDNSGRQLGFCTISGPKLVWPGGVLRVVASFPSSAEGRYAPDVLQRRSAEEVRRLRSMHGPEPNEPKKRKMQWQLERGRSC